MMIFMEKIEPPRPLVPLTDELVRLRMEAIANEELWVKSFIDRLARVVQDMEH